VTDARGNASGDAAHTTHYVYDETNRKIEEVTPDPNGTDSAAALRTWYYYLCPEQPPFRKKTWGRELCSLFSVAL
jgi:hypothetical protein